MAKRPPTSTAELLAEAGKHLYGEIGWSGPLAEILEINQRTLQAWASGKMQLKPDHDVMRRLHALLIAKRKATDALAKRIADNAATSAAAAPRSSRSAGRP